MAQTVDKGGITYIVDSATGTASATCTDKNIEDAVVEPAIEYEGVTYQVTALGDRAFYGCPNLKTVSLPSTLRSIGSLGFITCYALERVDIPSIQAWVEIDFKDGFSNPLYYAHSLYVSGEKAEDVVIPEGTAQIKANAFVGCDMRTVTVPATVESIGFLAFYQCSNLQDVDLSSSAAGSVGSQVFDSCTSLKTANLGGALSNLGSYAFSGCTALEELYIGENLTTVGDKAFTGCTALKFVDISSIAGWCGISFNGEESNPLLTAHELRLNGLELKHLEIPAHMESLPANVFAGCTSIESVVMPAALKAIGNSAFQACTGLATVDMGDAVETIGDYAFESCEALSECVLPDNLTSIGKYAFYGTALTEVTVPEQINVLPDGVFGICEALKKASLPDAITSIGFGCFYGCKTLEEVNIPLELTKLGKSAFYGCKLLKDIHLGEKVSSISSFAFSGCTGIENVYVSAVEPPVAPANAFSNYSATLWIPDESVGAYGDDSTWAQFAAIRPLSSGINDCGNNVKVRIDGCNLSFTGVGEIYMVSVYTLSGHIVYQGRAESLSLAPGAYIIRIAGKTFKVII